MKTCKKYRFTQWLCELDNIQTVHRASKCRKSKLGSAGIGKLCTIENATVCTELRLNEEYAGFWYLFGIS